MANKGTQEGQCQTGTASMAEAVVDCQSTGIKITVVFVFVVVVFPAISAMAASSVIPAGSAFAAASAAHVDAGRFELPEHSGLPPPPQGTEVSGDPGPLADTVPPEVLPDSCKLVWFPVKYHQLADFQI